MRLYTSYYANIKNIPADYLMVGISQFCPDWLKENQPDNFLFVKGNFLAPTIELLNDIKSGKISRDVYTERYEQQIDNFFKMCHCYKDIQDWYQKLDDEFSDRYSAIVFLCYEKPSDFCHRHILREIFAHKYMIRVDELECQSNLEINENKQSTPKALF